MDHDSEYAAYLQLQEWGNSAESSSSVQPALASRTSAASSQPTAGFPAQPINGWLLPASAVTALGNVCDPSLEMTDPVPDVRQLFLMFNEHVFSGRLSGVELRWSKTMTRCAGLCSYEGRGGLCSVRLSEPLLRLRPRSDLVNTLLHEMIHAWEFVASNARDHEAHGATFKQIAARCNEALGSNVTVFHTFHDEVKAHQKHVWRCSGPCQHKPPFYGWVRRAMNRPPQQADWWFEQHSKECGGTYSKVSEPDPEEKKKAAKRSAIERDAERAADAARKRSKGCMKIEDMLGAGRGSRSSAGTGGLAPGSKPLSSNSVEEDDEDADIVLVPGPVEARRSAGTMQGAAATRATTGAPSAAIGRAVVHPQSSSAGAGQIVLVESDDEEEDIVLVSPGVDARTGAVGGSTSR